MFSLKGNTKRSATLSACSALMLALASTSALAWGGVDEEEDDSPSKTQACSFIGCPNGNRVCGTATGKITSGAPPFIGEVAVSWTCYENALQ